MKNLLSLTLAVLLLLSLTACGEAPAQGSGSAGASADSSQAAPPAAEPGPVTTEEEVRALYAADYEADPTYPAIQSVEAYQGDFLVTLGTDSVCLDWVYGQSGLRRRMLCLSEQLLQCEITGVASVKVVTGGPNIFNGVPGFPHVETATLSSLYDAQGHELDYSFYSAPDIGGSGTYWANAGESYPMGMAERREAVRSAQIDAGGLTVAFAPLADGSDFIAAYCEIPYTEVALSQDGLTLTLTMHDTFLDSGKLADGVSTDFLAEYGSLYPESFPAGELTGSCALIRRAEIRQDGDNVVLTVTLDGSRAHTDGLGDGYFQFTAETGYTGIADIGPYLRVRLRVTNELFDD